MTIPTDKYASVIKEFGLDPAEFTVVKSWASWSVDALGFVSGYSLHKVSEDDDEALAFVVRNHIEFALGL